MTENQTTPAIERAAAALPIYRVGTARAVLAAGLNGPKDEYDCMDDVTISVHGAICEDSPEECVEWRGPCVKAVEAVRTAVLGRDS